MRKFQKKKFMAPRKIPRKSLPERKAVRAVRTL